MNKKTVFITGASRGIGRSIALEFARHNYQVLINCRSSTADLEAVKNEILALPGGSCKTLIGDVGKPTDVQELFAQINNHADTLDVLVNNAGAAHIGLLTDMTDAQWQDVIQTNLSSVFYCSRAAIPAMVRKKRGKIINISSMWGLFGASCEAAYSAAKAGVHGLTKAIAKELAPSNIQVNAVAFGVIDTAMNAQLTPAERHRLAEDIPAGRFGTPKEASDLVWKLANCPDYLTGQIITMDGGYL